jgi:thiol-disulfide isomerase/thioredoxin
MKPAVLFPGLLVALALASAVPTPADEATPQPILLGKTRPSTILSLSPAWTAEHDGYKPAAADLPVIAAAPRGATIDVYFGSWCGDSRRGVPHFLRILEAATDTRIKVRYYGVDRTKTQPAGLLAGVGLVKVPTFIYKVGGREVGRIVESPNTTLEHDLALLIARTSPAAP